MNQNRYKETMNRKFDINKVHDDVVFALYDQYANTQENYEKKTTVLSEHIQDTNDRKKAESSKKKRNKIMLWMRALTRPAQVAVLVLTFLAFSCISVLAYTGISQFFQYRADIKYSSKHGYVDGQKGNVQNVSISQESSNVKVTLESVTALNDQIFLTVTFETIDGTDLFPSTQYAIPEVNTWSFGDTYLLDGDNKINVASKDRIDDGSDTTKAEYEFTCIDSRAENLDTLQQKDIQFVVGDLRYNLEHVEKIDAAFDNVQQMYDQLQNQSDVIFDKSNDRIKINDCETKLRKEGDKYPVLYVKYQVPDESYVEEVCKYVFFNPVNGRVVYPVKKTQVSKKPIYEYEDGIVTLYYYPGQENGSTLDEMHNFTNELSKYQIMKAQDTTKEKIQGPWNFDLKIEHIAKDYEYEVDHELIIDGYSLQITKVTVNDDEIKISGVPNEELPTRSNMIKPGEDTRDPIMVSFMNATCTVIMSDGKEYELTKEMSGSCGGSVGTGQSGNTFSFKKDLKIMIDANCIAAIKINDQTIQLQ